MTLVGDRRSKKSAAAALVAGRAPKNPVVIRAKSRDALLPRAVGLGIAGTGLAHFTSPALFVPITKGPFPKNTRQWIYANGVTETVIGLAIANRHVRGLGVVGLVGYVGFLASRVVRA